jgi:hypothetical protein
LGHAPEKADGHVTIRPVTLLTGGSRQRVLVFVKPADVARIDEFRFFKRQGRTIQENTMAHAVLVAGWERRARETDENNERMEIIARVRGEAA